MARNIISKTLLAIGPRVNPSAGKITGPSMMFELLIQGLKDLNWSVSIIDIVDKNSSSENRKVGGFTWSRILFYLKLTPEIWRSLLKENNVVYLVIAPTLAAFIRDALVIWSAHVLRKKIVCHLFGDYLNFYSKQNKLLKKIISLTLSQVDKIIVEGELVKNYLSFVKNFENRVLAISNGLPERHLLKVDKPKSIINESVINILYMSNMIETKGYLDVLEAVRILVNERGHRIRCRFAGKFIVTSDATKYHAPDHAESDFFRYIKENNLDKFVSYSESIFGSTKIDEFKKAHFFILPSNYVYEMQPVSILEAMAYGVVVFGTNHKLIPDMLKDGETGYIVPYNAPEVIADKVESLIDNPELYEKFSQNSIYAYKNKFSAGIYCENVINVFREVSC